MEPINLITEQDQEFMRRYIAAYTPAHPQDISLILREWNHNKKTLFQALGNQLRVDFPIAIPQNKKALESSLCELYSIWDDNRNTFTKMLFHWANNHLSSAEITRLRLIISHCSIVRGTVSQHYWFPTLNLMVSEGTKTMRAIRKILVEGNFPYMDIFEDWRNNISNLFSNREINGTLTISIHPVDFITMSDNNCDWSTCMSWIDGAYSMGTIEMLNSPHAAMVYLNSDTLFAPHGIPAPNKSWRALWYLDANMLLLGKSYPYHNYALEKTAMECCICPLVHSNLSWTYEEMYDVYDNATNFAIITDIMYNDIEEDPLPYLCCYNQNKERYEIDVSGPIACLHCGDTFSPPCTDTVYEALCGKCESHKCNYCGKVIEGETYFLGKHNYCEQCAKETLYIPILDNYITRERLFSQPNLEFYFVNTKTQDRKKIPWFLWNNKHLWIAEYADLGRTSANTIFVFPEQWSKVLEALDFTPAIS